MLWNSLIIGLLITLASWAGVGLAVQAARRFGLYDIPNERSSHTVTTPRGGGIVIVLFVLLGLVPSLFKDYEIFPIHVSDYMLAGFFIAAISLVDDVHSLPSLLRLGCHLMFTLLIIRSTGYLTEIELIPGVVFPLGLAGLAVTLLWVIGLTNVYNFMDGIDGIAGGQAVVAGLGWAYLGNHLGSGLVLTSGLLIAFSSLGFLFYNWAPARIFMGDVGSAFLGFTFAVLPLLAAFTEAKDYSLFQMLACGALLVWPFVADGAYTFLHRLVRRENIFQPHRSHLYQRLVITGLSHAQVSSLYIAMAVCGFFLCWPWLWEWTFALYLTAGVLLPLFAGLRSYTIRREQRLPAASS